MKTQFLKISFGIFFLTVTFFPVFSQNYDIEIKRLLPEEKIEFEILDSVEVTIRQTELMAKFQKAFAENMAAFNTYFEKKRNNQKAKYPKNKILSEKELIELESFANNMKLLSSQTEIVEIIYSNNNISFKSNGKLAILNMITYHAETNTFVLDNYQTLNFKNTVNVETNTNALQEAWKGYIWEFAEPEDIEDLSYSMEDLYKMSMKQYRITLGKLTNSGKTFMDITIKSFQDGVWILNIEIPIRMK